MNDFLSPIYHQMITALFMLFVPFFVGYGLVLYFKIKKYKRSQYYAQTNYSFFKVVLNTGLYGEYLCVSEIEKHVQQPLILTNLYLPHPTKKDRTTEIDLVFINQTGVHVIESKNYSGWIFGRSQDRYWTQSLPNRKKNKFFNPIKQNELHLKAIIKSLNIDRDLLFSWIVFSDRSTLKKISSPDIPVLNRKNWPKKLLNLSSKTLSPENQLKLYQSLLPFSKVSDDVRKAHIDAIQSKKAPLR